MWEWIIGALLGFLSEFARGLYRDHAASQTLREAGRLEQENNQLKEQANAHTEAQAIKEKINAETDLGAVIDGL
ncbi:hypothetical protein SAMN04515647_4270 [Cohaesibacter sp. ES.047]|uniref:hypothetical protein n=1 Tax=Cohaesibacter sp. ES.047 TaxID=1798205 RepID=UPI000BB88E03|nr:hypothetical protein [Cohaesibacter sp. ES.047]SNY93948.1 hypothetical protein SAMN04515647_4270 [Cohaesibacter sp. ES.047]